MPITLCGPAIVQISFTITQVIIDIYKGVYNTAFMKFITMLVIALALNILCNMGASLVAWLIVFVPFISMTVMTVLIAIAVGTEKRQPSFSTKQELHAREKELKRKTHHMSRVDERRNDDAQWHHHSHQERRWREEASRTRREDEYADNLKLENTTDPPM